MEVLFSPERYAYVTSAKEGADGCTLCRLRDAEDDAPSLVLHRAAHCYIVVNRYPYNSGHLMIVPNRHAAELGSLSSEERIEMIELAGRTEAILSSVYKSQGLNLGMNLGEAAGAGILGHLHLHLIPRWKGDTNFMSVVGATRVLPEEPSRTYERLRPIFDEAPRP